VFKTKYNYYGNLVEEFLSSLPLDESLLCSSMKYSLVAGGKRIRPVLALASAEAVGGDPLILIRVASALELIHTYSLIHDDLPCMDNDDYRRGKLSNHKQFNETIALLAGDALLTYGFELLAQSLPVDPKKQLLIVKETAQAVGWMGMVGGQVLDTLGENRKLSFSDIEKIHEKKTGDLLKASVRLGAILGGGTDDDIEKLTAYASNIGLAFQIKDDVLDIEGDAKELGKPVGSDEASNKSTYPSLLGLEGAKLHLNNCIAEAKGSIESFGLRGEFLSQLADYIANRKK